MEEEIAYQLDRRYLECDVGGHILPNKEKTYCNYCFRRLDYLANAISEQDKRSLDRLNGLGLLRKELFPERLLLR